MLELKDKRIYLENGYEIREYLSNKGNIIALYSNNAFLSLSYLDDSIKFELPNNYLKLYDIVNDLNKNGNNYLVLGGGTLSYPKYYIKRYKNKKMTVVEIDKNCIEISKKYFFLNELYKKYDEKKERLKIIVDDAINYINNSKDKFDYILIDLFYGEKVIEEIYSKDNLSKICNLLNNNGILVANYIINNDAYEENLLNLTKLKKHYKFVTLKENFDYKNKVGNIFVIISQEEIKIPLSYNVIEITNYIIKKYENV